MLSVTLSRPGRHPLYLWAASADSNLRTGPAAPPLAGRLRRYQLRHPCARPATHPSLLVTVSHALLAVLEQVSLNDGTD